MRPYTKEGLARQQQQQQEGKGGATGTGTAKAGGSPREEEGEAFPDSYYEYKLAGVLVHMGTADSGHYYSYIKRRDTQVSRMGSAFSYASMSLGLLFVA